MFTTVPLSPWLVVSDSHDEHHAVKDGPSLYTTRHFDDVVLAKALGPHSHEVALVGGAGGGGADNGGGDRIRRRGGGRACGRNGGRGRGAAGTGQGGATGAAADN